MEKTWEEQLQLSLLTMIEPYIIFLHANVKKTKTKKKLVTDKKYSRKFKFNKKKNTGLPGTLGKEFGG